MPFLTKLILIYFAHRICWVLHLLSIMIEIHKPFSMTYRLILFLILNFGALALGGLFTNNGVNSEWYANLNKAPWTPPGWVFGFAWTTIMICFSIYMAKAYTITADKNSLIALFVVQWILNVGWNPLFFHYHLVSMSFFTIIALTGIVGFMLFYYRSQMHLASLLLLPYFLWLLVAASLNGYALKN